MIEGRGRATMGGAVVKLLDEIDAFLDELDSFGDLRITPSDGSIALPSSESTAAESTAAESTAAVTDGD